MGVRRLTGILVFCLAFALPILELEGQTRQTAGADSFLHMEEAIRAAIGNRQAPGAVVCIGNKKEISYLKAFGQRSLKPERAPMEKTTVFDLASLTKPIATATSVMILLEEGKIRLRDPVTRYLPKFGVNGKRSITIKQLLTHTGGLIPDNALADYKDGREVAMQKIFGLAPIWEPGSKFAYTDVGFIVLGEIVEKESGQSLSEFTNERIFQRIGMQETTFNPPGPLQKRAAVTRQRNDKWIRGAVHDPRAYEMGGVAGHAGLFSTATDLAKYCQMFLNDGRVGDQKILSPATIELMTRSYDLPGGIQRGLGWDKDSPYSSNRGELMSEQAFGHGGFTGTAIWIDPNLDLFVVFLSNRVHPDGKGKINRLAGRIGTIAAAHASRTKKAK